MVENKHLVVCGVAAAAIAAGAGIAFYQLSKILYSVVRESDYEAGRLIAAVTALLNSDNPDQEVPEEMEMDDEGLGVWAYGSLQELFFRRSVGGDSDWEWSFDKLHWQSTDNLECDMEYVLDPPSIIFITRLHLLSVMRCKIAAAAAAAADGDSTAGGDSSSSAAAAGAAAARYSRVKPVPRIPPPLELPAWAAQQLQQMQEQRGAQLLQDWQQQPRCQQQQQQQCGRCRHQAPRHISEAPDALCCPITGQIMLQPVTLPSGRTFEHDAVRRWITQHGSDPVTLTPASIHDLYPNLLVREMAARWLAGTDPLGGSADDSETGQEQQQQHEEH